MVELLYSAAHLELVKRYFHSSFFIMESIISTKPEYLLLLKNRLAILLKMLMYLVGI